MESELLIIDQDIKGTRDLANNQIPVEVVASMWIPLKKHKISHKRFNLSKNYLRVTYLDLKVPKAPMLD